MAKKEANKDLWVYDLLKEVKINDKFLHKEGTLKK